MMAPFWWNTLKHAAAAAAASPDVSPHYVEHAGPDNTGHVGALALYGGASVRTL